MSIIYYIYRCRTPTATVVGKVLRAPVLHCLYSTLLYLTDFRKSILESHGPRHHPTGLVCFSKSTGSSFSRPTRSFLQLLRSSSGKVYPRANPGVYFSRTTNQRKNGLQPSRCVRTDSVGTDSPSPAQTPPQTVFGRTEDGFTPPTTTTYRRPILLAAVSTSRGHIRYRQ